MGETRENARRSRRTSGEGASGGMITARIAAALAVVVLVSWGVWEAFSRMRSSWLSQCVVTDVAAQVAVRPSAHVSAEVVKGLFGLTNGCNLALVDFEALSAKAMREHPIIKSIDVVRHLPNRVDIAVEERKPIARVNFSSSKIRTASGQTVDWGRWDVVDSEGMVFNYKRDDSKLLPRIVEARPSAKKGERLAGRALSAARLVELGSRKEYASLGILAVSVTNATYMIAATSDYNLIKIDWNFVDDPSGREQPHLEDAVSKIKKVAASGLAGPLRSEFIITEAGRVSVRPYDRESAR
jgi:hypothetical protein